ncbi:hypothetical protein TRSC58_00017 [Trypanosoma rangeli SC58]|uniref:Amastin n=1 Tax=Trypanosoma rangeli SC58 TaxID=429131 RepID=A0A061JBC5_TRYRA|nr:hypothetical protein TRSC58_00017 [Trypanosoma rangeli SC58]
MCCCPTLRVLVLIMVLLATACAVCANIFPVFQKKNNVVTIKQTLWYNRTALSGGNEIEQKVSESLCTQYKLFFQVSEAMVVATVGVGLIVVGFAIAQLIIAVKGRCLACCGSFLITLAFDASGVCVALLVYGYMKGYCQNDTSLSSVYAPFKDQNYKFAESFYLISVACGLFLISSLFECFT